MNNSDKKINFDDALKKMFDHFRNYLIAASLLYVGLEALEHPEWHYLGEFGSWISYWVIGISVILAALNSYSVLMWIHTNIKPIKVRGRNRATIVKPIVLFSYLAFAYVIIIVSINIKWA